MDPARRRDRMLVVGAAGMFGHMACRALRDDFDLYATCRGAWADDAGLHDIIDRDRCTDRCDVTDGARMQAVLREVGPAFVLNGVGVIKQKSGADDPVRSIAVNALFPHQLAEWCAAEGAKLVQIGTDCVFSGARGGYRETDTPDPSDLYGRSKLLGEVSAPPHLTLRTSMIGRQLCGREGLLEWFIGQRGGRVRGFRRAVFSGLTTRALCGVIGRVLRDAPGLSGIYHVAAAPISKHELLTRINELMALEVRIEADDAFACNRSLDGGLFLRDSGVAVPSWTSMLEELANDHHYARSLV